MQVLGEVLVLIGACIAGVGGVVVATGTMQLRQVRRAIGRSRAEASQLNDALHALSAVVIGVALVVILMGAIVLTLDRVLG